MRRGASGDGAGRGIGAAVFQTRPGAVESTFLLVGAPGKVITLCSVAAEKLVTEYAWKGPKRGADRAVLLAHGAGSDLDGAALVAVAGALAKAGVPSLRFNYPYRTARKNAPDRPKVLDAATREAAAELGRRAKLAPDRLVLGGRSMGGRYCSLVVGAEEDP